MTKEDIVTIDVGTQSTRAAVVTSGGEILGIAQIPHETDSPQPGWAQQRPAQWCCAQTKYENAYGMSRRTTGFPQKPIRRNKACVSMS